MKFAHTPRRVVSLQPSATVILQAIDQLDRLVACTRYCVDVCPQAASGRIIVHDSWTAHSDEIIAARPELVIAAVPYQEKSVVEILKSGARFLGLAPKTLADIYTDIVSIAGVLGVPERGERVVNAMEGEIELVRNRMTGLPRPRVFCEEWGKPLIASQIWVAELVEAAGGEFIGTPGRETTTHNVSSADPDALIAAWCGAGDRVPLEKIMRDREWTGLRAVREGRVYCVRDELLNTPAPTLISGLHALAAAIHPESFAPVPGLRRITDASRETRTPDAPVV
ncbi:MAG: ABC transporter substrate-binding protein [Terriglobales bacterium]